MPCLADDDVTQPIHVGFMQAILEAGAQPHAECHRKEFMGEKLLGLTCSRLLLLLC
jgi:hypothetical protein